MSDPRLERARSAIESGDKVTAGRILMALLNDDPQNERAWLLLSRVVSSLQRKRQCLETVLEINPHNDQARSALRRLQALEMVREEEEVTRVETPTQARPETTYVFPPETAVPNENQDRNVSGNNRWLFLLGGILLICICCASPFWIFSGGRSALDAVVDDGESVSERRVIPSTYTPASGARPVISGGPSGSTVQFGQIAISRPRLAEYAQRSSLSMSFYRDLNYTDGTYHHTMCTRDCQQKLVMRSETFDRDDLDNLDFSFIYANDDEFTLRSLALLNIVGLALPEWEEGLHEWYLDSAETYLRGGRDTFYASNNGVDVQLDFFYDAVDLEDAVIVSVME